MAELQREAITARIRQARTESGLTQDEMADVLDVARRTYWNYEDSREGEGRVPWSLLDKIAEVTGKSTSWLIHGDGVSESDPPRQAQLERIEGKLDEVRDLVELLATDRDAAGESDTGSSAEESPGTSDPELPPREDAAEP